MIRIGKQKIKGEIPVTWFKEKGNWHFLYWCLKGDGWAALWEISAWMNSGGGEMLQSEEKALSCVISSSCLGWKRNICDDLASFLRPAWRFAYSHLARALDLLAQCQSSNELCNVLRFQRCTPGSKSFLDLRWDLSVQEWRHQGRVLLVVLDVIRVQGPSVPISAVSKSCD